MAKPAPAFFRGSIREAQVPFMHAGVQLAPDERTRGPGARYDSGSTGPDIVTNSSPTFDTDDLRAASSALTRRELLLVAAFWLLFGAVVAAGRLFDPRGPGLDSPVPVALATVALVQSALWALATVLVFALFGRLDPDHGERLAKVFLVVAVAVMAALVIHVVGNLVRFEMLEDIGREFGGRGGGRRGPRGGPRGGPFRIDRFGIVNELVTAGAVVAAAIARDASMRYRMRREQATRLQAQLAEARLDALRRQLDPHFLFNTLNAVSALVERDPRGVRRMIARLSELLRHSMEGSDDAEIPLERELALLQLYVDIMMVRFQGKLEVTMAIDDRARDALVPQLVLQPLVENAIRHGVAQMEAHGRIAVTAAVQDGTLRLRVHDNGRGIGVPGAPAAEAVPARGGVGLRNTRARLAQLYGDAQRLVLEPAPDGGTVAEVTIPFHTRVMAATSGGPSS